ncbi:hypothetical protein WUBG_03507, partial [Wuchereria bancrofti]
MDYSLRWILFILLPEVTQCYIKALPGLTFEQLNGKGKMWIGPPLIPPFCYPPGVPGAPGVPVVPGALAPAAPGTPAPPAAAPRVPTAAVPGPPVAPAASPAPAPAPAAPVLPILGKSFG